MNLRARTIEMTNPLFRPNTTVRQGRRSLGILLALGLFLSVGTASALPLHTGDINTDEARNVLDVNCMISSALSEAQGLGAPPQCQTVSNTDADLQCDGSIDVTDVQRLTLIVLHTLTADAEVEDLLRAKDHDLDYIHNDCDPDDDNDLYPDLCEIDNQTNPFNDLSVPLIPNACSCPNGCIIEEQCTEAATVNSDAPCLVCDPYVNPFGWSPASDIPCDDGDACTTVDACSIGSCNGSVPLACDDDNPCTDDGCDSQLGCSYTNNTNPCADGDPCTMDDQCSDGSCNAGVDNPQCEDSICALSGAEDDLVVCPIRVARELQGAEAATGLQFSLGYDPGDLEFVGLQDTLCILDLCAEVAVPPAALDPSGHSVVISPQNPEDWLIGGSVILMNSAVPTSILSDAYLSAGFINGDAEVLQAKFKLRDDISAENGSLVAVSNTLASTADAEPLIVSVGLSNSGPVLVTGQAGCNNSDAACDDANPCTTEACDPTSNTCVFTAISGPACTDNNACTINDFCGNGLCEGTPLNCDDGTSCTIDSCDPGLGCTFELVECNDDNPCTDDDCIAATGCNFTDVTCDDGIACTVDSCDGDSGACVHDNSFCGCASAADCDDGNPCTADSCGTDFNCSSTPAGGADCNDNNACTVEDTCQSNGTCAGTASVCDDNDACTNDSCDEAVGCVIASVTCDDGDACTTDSCDSLTGCTTTTISCDDNNACTVDSCDEAAGCVFTAEVCDDNNACTTDSCDEGLGCQTEPVVCDDNSACTTDACDVSLGCTTEAIECDDGNNCTIDSCSDVEGCVFDAAIGTDCDDGDACTTGDSCTAQKTCIGSSGPSVCDDQNPCTIDSCDTDTGCLHDQIEGCGITPETLLCNISGGSGEEVTCTIYVARNLPGSPPPGAIQFDLVYDSSQLTLVQFEDTVCPGQNNCFLEAVPPAALYPSGHTASISPAPIGQWDGVGTIILSNESNGLTPLTNAFIQGDGTLSGDAQAVDVRFSLNQNVIVPSAVQLINPAGATPDAKPMTAAIDLGVLVYSLEDCNTLGDDACDDGDACTTDTCLTNGSCSSTPVTQCDDGNACTTEDICTNGTCAGVPQADCDDSDACTNDTCDDNLGCVFDPINCDDGDLCTTESCDAVAGCVFAPVACDDNDPCTDDSCAAGVCVFTPSSAPACQPEPPACDALCTITGNAGDTVDCEMKVASFDDLSAPAAALEFNMSYDASVLKVVNFYSDKCFNGSWVNGVCTGTNSIELSVAATGQQAFPLDSGHSITLLPTSFDDWVDGGAVVMTPSTSPPPPVGTAYCENGDGEAPYSKDPKFMILRMELTADAPPEGTPVCLSDLGGATAVPITLAVELNSEGVLITSE